MMPLQKKCVLDGTGFEPAHANIAVLETAPIIVGRSSTIDHSGNHPSKRGRGNLAGSCGSFVNDPRHDGATCERADIRLTTMLSSLPSESRQGPESCRRAASADTCPGLCFVGLSAYSSSFGKKGKVWGGFRMRKGAPWGADTLVRRGGLPKPSFCPLLDWYITESFGIIPKRQRHPSRL